ncbi:alpha/beta fold hydrolase [Solimonas marina]|uniref:Alpha/beta hydrolase n=1 Tax=Solimonas marina TaxID=2714601 RepID=A0A969W9I3_9GAMM|nr:alpha/beta hydrolase [Solimonas marina]
MTDRPKLAHQQLGAGPDIVLVHGLGANRAFWYPVGTQLAQRYRVTLYDLRGHGYSEKPSKGYTATEQADDLLDLLDRLGIERAALVGHSYGGAIALEAAIAAPQRFSHLALLDTRVQRLQPQLRLSDVDHLTAFEQAVAKQDGDGWDEEPEVGMRFLEAAARHKVAGIELGVRDAFTPFGEGRGGIRAAKQWLALLDGTSLAADFRTPGADVVQYAKLTMPCLLQYAGHTRAGRSADALMRYLPDARFIDVPQAGHFFPATHPAAVLSELDALLNR